jgi:membrane protease YdiL (CAAX protease family)
VIAAAIVAAWWWVGRSWIDPEAARATAEKAGIGVRERYLLGALYWCTVNSLLEEYAWRWFVTTRFEAIVPRPAAVLASAAAFSLHHAIGLGAYFDARVTALGTLGVFIGGAAWSWIYVRYRNIWAAYVCHVCADLAVFWVGWRVLFG